MVPGENGPVSSSSEPRGSCEKLFLLIQPQGAGRFAASQQSRGRMRKSSPGDDPDIDPIKLASRTGISFSSRLRSSRQGRRHLRISSGLTRLGAGKGSGRVSAPFIFLSWSGSIRSRGYPRASKAWHSRSFRVPSAPWNPPGEDIFRPECSPSLSSAKRGNESSSET